MNHTGLNHAATGLAIIVLLATACVCPAQQTSAEKIEEAKKKRPIAKVSEPMLRARTGGMMVLEVKIEYEGKKVLRGPLRLTLARGSEAVAVIETPPIVHAGTGELTQRYLVPAMERLRSDEPATVSVRFDSDQGAFDLGRHTIVPPISGERSMTIGVCDPFERRGGRSAGLVGSLALDRFKADKQESWIGSMPVYFKPEEMAAEPIALTVFDVIALPPQGFAALDEKQCEALGKWLAAGGSVFVVLSGGLGTHHARFLNDAMAGSGDRFQLNPRDAEGLYWLTGDARVRVDSEGSDARIGMYHSGLGRLVVAIEPREAAFYDSDAWKTAVAFLWKARASQMAAMVYGRGWDRGQEQPSPWRSLQEDLGYAAADGPNRRAGQLEYHPLPIPSGGQIPTLLMPISVRVVPFWLVVGILILFALAVGPGDWFLLGLLRMRKLTWLLFPALAMAFTLLTIVVADRYMGTTDQERSMVIADVDEVGTVLRQTRIELLFPARHTNLQFDMRDELVRRMYRDQYEASPGYEDYSHRGRPRHASEEEAEPALIAGRMPGRYAVRQSVKKWTQRLNRFTAIAPLDAEPPTHIAWAKLDTDALGRGGPAIRQALLGDRPFDGAIVVYQQSREGRVVHGSLTGSGVGFPSNVTSMVELLADINVRPREGLFTVVSQVSPNGSDTLEDLSIHDATDPHACLVVVVEAKGDSLMVYRHVYRKQGAGS